MGPDSAAPSTPSDVVLEVRDLITEFPVVARGARIRWVRAANQVSFDIRRGETLGLVGESGSGKSITAASIMRLVPPPGRTTGGVIRLEGRDLLQVSEPDMQRVRGARIGFVSQEPMTALNPVFSIGDQVGEALVVHGLASRSQARARAVELLEAVRIPDAAERVRDYPHQLSGGMRQRALIAAALACSPTLLIADEPTTALDVTIQAEILDLLREMRARLGLSVLVITHDLGVVAELADHVAVMYAGRIIEQGPVRRILGSPQHPYTRGLLASLPGLVPGQRLNAIGGTVPNLLMLPPGCAFAPRCPDRLTVCDHRTPDTVAVGTGHTARCHLYGAST